MVLKGHFNMRSFLHRLYDLDLPVPAGAKSSTHLPLEVKQKLEEKKSSIDDEDNEVSIPGRT